ncbi:MAG: GAF domain-containing protein [Chloroflexota bacterium]
MIKSSVTRYAIIGAIMGLMFPILGTFWDIIFIQNISVTIQNIILVQTTNPMHWIIDSAPFVLAAFASFAGLKQEQVKIINTQLTSQLKTSQLLTGELEKVQNTLEEDIYARTKDLERRAKFTEAATTVGQAATSIYNLEELLPLVTSLISEQFGFYHAGIFLLDDQSEYAVLRAANSEGGQRLLARKHRLKIGEEGIVGYVAGTGDPRIALDVGEDAVHFDNPDLPDTRSEIGLPIYSGGRITGVLNVQSRQSNAFSKEDITALQILADQVAMAINNAQLFAQLQESVISEQKARGEISKESWKNLLSRRGDIGYKYQNGLVSQASDTSTEQLGEAIEFDSATENVGDRSLVIPIQVRGRNIGIINLKREDTSKSWSLEDKSSFQQLSEQLGLALESARLYEETQRKAMNEQIISEISSRSRETLDVEEILKTAAEEVRKSLELPEVSVRLIPTLPQKPTNGKTSRTVN